MSALTINEIIAIGAAHEGVSVHEIMGPRRTREVVQARWRVIWAVRHFRPDLSYPATGRIFGLDHSSIIHAINSLEALMRANPEERASTDSILRAVDDRYSLSALQGMDRAIAAAEAQLEALKRDRAELAASFHRIRIERERASAAIERTRAVA